MNSGQSAGKEEGHWAGPTSALLGQHYSGSDTQLQCCGKAASVMSKRALLFPQHFFFWIPYESTACRCAVISLLTFRCTHVYIDPQNKAMWLSMNAPDYPEMCDFGI